MGQISFRGISTASLANVAVMKMPDHRKAARRVTEFYVNGRDGALHIDNGLADIELEATLVLLDAGAKTRQIVNAWADGTGKLITSDDPTRAYKASVIQEIVWKRTVAASLIDPFDATEDYTAGDFVKNSGTVYEFIVDHEAGAWNANHVAERPWLVKGLFDTAKIRFTCDPYMYEANETVVVLDADGMITNPGSAAALPLIEVSGSGDATFSVNGNEITIEGMTSGTTVYIDSAAGYVYTEEEATAITGDFPVLQMGLNTITLGENVSLLRITPRWRWV